jgi:hypothetical protein
VLRVSMVRMELCSTRTMGRSAWSGIVRACGEGVRGYVGGDPIASVTAGASEVGEQQPAERAGGTTAVTAT